MNTITKNIVGGAGLVALGFGMYFFVKASIASPEPAGSERVAAAAATKATAATKKRHPALDIDISSFNAEQIIAFVRGLGSLSDISEEDRIALFKKLKTRFDTLDGPEKLVLMTAAMEAYDKNKLDPMVVNGRELMKAYQHEMLMGYFKANPAERKKILDERIQEQLDMETLRKMNDIAGMFGKQGDSQEKRITMMRQQIGDAIQDSIKNGTPEDRAMMTQFMIEMRVRRVERGLKVMF